MSSYVSQKPSRFALLATSFILLGLLTCIQTALMLYSDAYVPVLTSIAMMRASMGMIVAYQLVVTISIGQEPLHKQ